MKAYVSFSYTNKIGRGFGRVVAKFRYDKPTEDELLQVESKMKEEFECDAVIIMSVIPVEV